MITQCPKTGRTCEVTGCAGCWKDSTTQDEIIRMAREAGFEGLLEKAWGIEQLERFFNLAFAAGAARERERTKDLTDDEILEITKRFALGIAFPVDGVTTPEMFARAVIAADREKNK